MKGKRMIAWLLSTAMLTAMLPVTSFAAEGKLPCVNHQEHTAVCGFKKGKSCQHKSHTKKCFTKELVCSLEENTASKSNADLPHEHTLDCYMLDCPHERGIHTTVANDQESSTGLSSCGYAEAEPCGHACELCSSKDGANIPGLPDQNISKYTDSNAAGLLTASKGYNISGDGYSFDKAAGSLVISSDAGTTAWKANSNIDSSSIKSVELENGVTTIGNNAFLDCKNLQNLDLSACISINTIEYSAFEGCESLILDKLPDQITSIEGYAFKDCTSLALTSLPNDLTTMGNGTFMGCENLALTSLPDGLTSIPSFTFKGCKSLDLTSLSNNVNRIGNSAFSGCINLELDTLPEGLTEINQYAFHGCSKLKLEELPEQVETIGSHAFYECTRLKLKSLPSNITSIGSAAFWKCTGISSLTISNTTAPLLDKNTFEYIPNLTIFVPYNATGYDGENWPKDRVVYGAALSDLTMDGGSLSPKFFPGTNTYTVSVDNRVERVRMIPTAHDSEAIAVNGTSVASGTSSGEIELMAGKITAINVIAKNSDEDSRTYTVNVMRMAPDTIPVTGLTLDQTELTLYTNKNPGSTTLSARIQPDNATIQAISWSSSAPDIARVDNNGTVTAVSPGAAIITATTMEGGKTAVCTVTVEEEAEASIPVTGVKLNVDELTLYTNKNPDTALLSAEIQPGNATNQEVIWSSSAPDIAAVDGSGKVRAVSPGSASITVTTIDGGKTASCIVTVKEEPPVSIPVAGVTLDKTVLTLYTNQAPGSATLTASIQPENAADQRLIWNSSNLGVAEVDNQGKVTAVSPGSSVITVTTVDGGRTASCAVTVKSGGTSSSVDNSDNYDSDNGPSYLRRVLTDKATGITVAGNKINEYAALAVKPDTLHHAGDAGCDILRAAQGAGRVLSLYDISLSHGFLGKVTVSIPVEGRDGQTMTLVSCVGGNLTLFNVTAERGMVTVTVDSLSPFVLLNDIYTLDTLAAPQMPEPAALPPDTASPRRYRVKKGDTLSSLAQRYHCTVADIVAANSIIQDPDFILPGWMLEIP